MTRPPRHNRLGHTDPALALSVYRQAMRRDDDERAQLRALVEGVVLTGDSETGEVEQAVGSA